MTAHRVSFLSGPAPTRRRLLHGALATGALALAPGPSRSAFAAPTRAPVLSGTEFQLEIGAVPINVTGRHATATAASALVPAPILRWREGETVTPAVTNRLAETSSIHWHGVRTPAPMDGVPGLSYRSIAPGETLSTASRFIKAGPIGTTAIRCSRNRKGSTARS